MTAIFNQYSYAFMNLCLIALVVIMLWRLSIRQRSKILLTALVILGLAGGYLLVRPGASDVATVEEAEILLANGRPTFLEFFSNY